MTRSAEEPQAALVIEPPLESQEARPRVRSGEIGTSYPRTSYFARAFGRMSAARPQRSIRVAAILPPLRERSPAKLPAGLLPSGHDRLRGLSAHRRHSPGGRHAPSPAAGSGHCAELCQFGETAALQSAQADFV
jgi:hypothetical protein